MTQPPESNASLDREAPSSSVLDQLDHEPKRILVIKSRNIGDVLLTSSLISTLKQRYPKAEISALVKPGTEAMLINHPDLVRVLTYPRQNHDQNRLGFMIHDLSWQRGLKRYRFDLCINTTEGERGALTARLAGIPVRIGLPLTRNSGWRKNLLTHVVPPIARSGRHTVIQNLDILGLPLAEQNRQVTIQVLDENRTQVAHLLMINKRDTRLPLVWVHAASRWFFKCWSNNHMATVIKHIQNAGAQVVLTSGPDDRERYQVQSILNLCTCQQKPMDLSGRLSLTDLMALAETSDMFFGVDSAPMHIAAALDVPVVALFGPSGAFDWGPWPNGWQKDPTPYPLRGGIQYAGPHTVIQKDWDCVPCGQDGCAGSKKSRCLDELTPEEVIPEIDRTLSLILSR